MPKQKQKQQTIQIPLFFDSNRFQMVETKVRIIKGNFAIHHPHEGSNRDWVITHIPTGGRASGYISGLGAAVEELDRLAAKTWRGRPLHAIPPCELVDVIPLIERERGVAQKYIDDWVRYQQPAFRNALACASAASGEGV